MDFRSGPGLATSRFRGMRGREFGPTKREDCSRVSGDDYGVEVGWVRRNVARWAGHFVHASGVGVQRVRRFFPAWTAGR